MSDLKLEIDNARLRFNSLADASAPAADSRLRETLNLAAQTLEELEALQEEIATQNQELENAWKQGKTEQARYQELFDFAPENYVITDRHGTVRELNLAAAALFNGRRAFSSASRLSHFSKPRPIKTFICSSQRR